MIYFMDTEFHEFKKKPEFTMSLGNGDIYTSDYGIDTIDLISIGIVAEDGRKYYAICNEFGIDAAWNNDWLKKNVLVNLFTVSEMGEGTIRDDITVEHFTELIMGFGKTKKVIAEEIEMFVKDFSLEQMEETPEIEKPEFYGYYADYDWVVFCWLYGRMIDLPTGYPMYCKDLKQLLDDQAYMYKEVGESFGQTGLEHIKSMREYPKQDGLHNALSDAQWNKELYKFIGGL